MLLVTSCPWTGRALELALADAEYATFRVPELSVAGAVCAGSVIDGVIVDDRALPAGWREHPETARAALAPLIREPTRALLLLATDGPSPADFQAAFAAGAWGVLPYPLGAPWWLRQLGVWVDAGRAARQRTAAGLIDAETGLYNARGLVQRAQELDATVRRNGGALACAVFGLERAGAVSDDRGVAQTCRRLGRASDVFGRVADAEFAVIAPGADADGVQALVERIAQAVGTGQGAARLRVGVYGVHEALTSSVSVEEMLAHAARRRPPRLVAL